MASSSISGMAITNDLPSVFCWVSQMASSLISCFISGLPDFAPQRFLQPGSMETGLS